MRLRVLTWNLFHGRSVPGSGRDGFDDFAGALAGWPWDVALLQEVPPWWPAPLAVALDAETRSVSTSRGALLWTRRWLAVRRPDLVKSWGGGANAVLARRDRLAARQDALLCRAPERRRVLGVQIGDGSWVGTTHCSSGPSPQAARDAERAADALSSWAGSAPAVLGGDLNLRGAVTLPGWRRVASSDVDHVFVRGDVRALGPGETLPRGALSDHAPLLVELSVGPYHDPL